jgi:hypothetical protein
VARESVGLLWGKGKMTVRPENIREFVAQRPFRPFRLTLTDGLTYDLRHPDLIMVGQGMVVVGLPAADQTEPIFDRFAMISLLHIMQIEPLEKPTVPTSPPGTGPESVTAL